MTDKPEFKREARYIVIKRTDLDRAPTWKKVELSLALELLDGDLPKRDYVVIESDWPEYEPVWKMLEARVTGADSVPPAGGEPGSITLTPEHAERLINRLSKAQMFKEVTELRAVMAQPVRPLAGLPERHDFPHRSEFETANQYTSALDTAKTWNAAWDEWAPHVTRLQAEVSAANSRLHDVATLCATIEQERNALQSELTKARELLREWMTSNFTGSCPERNDLRCRTDYALSNQSAPADKGQVNPEHTVFNEIRISEPVNEEGEPTRYLITEAQLQRIRALEADKGQDPNKADRLAVAALQRQLNESRDRVYDLEHAIFHALDDSGEDATTGEITIYKLDFEKLSALVPEDWEHRSEADKPTRAERVEQLNQEIATLLAHDDLEHAIFDALNGSCDDSTVHSLQAEFKALGAAEKKPLLEGLLGRAKAEGNLKPFSDKLVAFLSHKDATREPTDHE